MGRDRASCSVTEHDEIWDPGKVLHVARDERRLVDDGCCRDQEVHRRDPASRPLVPCEKPRVGRRKALVGKRDPHTLEQAPDVLSLARRVRGQLRAREELARHVHIDPQILVHPSVEEPRGWSRGVPRSFPEEIDQERSVEVDQRVAGLVACARRRRTCRSMARRVSVDT